MQHSHPQPLTILITGGTGLIGKHLCRQLRERGHQVRILSRRPTDESAHRYHWNIEEGFIEPNAFDGIDTVIHLAGAGIADKAWSAARKRVIVDSRVRGTELLVHTIRERNIPIQQFIVASGVGYYGMTTTDTPYKEDHPASDDFLGATCVAWEQASEPLDEMAVRRVVFRTGIVLAKEGGAYPKFRGPLRFGVVPILGSGLQFIPWIHIDDVCRLYIHACEEDAWQGIYNMATPHAVRLVDFMRILRDQINSWIPLITVPSWFLRIVLGSMAEMLLNGSPTDVQRLLARGYTFKYTSLEQAIEDLR